jgi:hypothetical protein
LLPLRASGSFIALEETLPPRSYTGRVGWKRDLGRLFLGDAVAPGKRSSV